MTCGYLFPMHIQCVSHSIFNSGQHFTLSFSTYSSHTAVVPTRLLLAHPPAPELGTHTRWRWSILLRYTGWWSSILYWYTGWRWSTPDTLEWNIVAWRQCELTCGFPSLCIFYAFRIRFLIQDNISHCSSLLPLPMQL